MSIEKTPIVKALPDKLARELQAKEIVVASNVTAFYPRCIVYSPDQRELAELHLKRMSTSLSDLNRGSGLEKDSTTFLNELTDKHIIIFFNSEDASNIPAAVALANATLKVRKAELIPENL